MLVCCGLFSRILRLGGGAVGRAVSSNINDSEQSPFLNVSKYALPSFFLAFLDAIQDV